MLLAPVGPDEAAGLDVGVGAVRREGVDDLRLVPVDLGEIGVEVDVDAAPHALVRAANGHDVGLAHAGAGSAAASFFGATAR